MYDRVRVSAFLCVRAYKYVMCMIERENDCILVCESVKVPNVYDRESERVTLWRYRLAVYRQENGFQLFYSNTSNLLRY